MQRLYGVVSAQGASRPSAAKEAHARQVCVQQIPARFADPVRVAQQAAARYGSPRARRFVGDRGRAAGNGRQPQPQPQPQQRRQGESRPYSSPGVRPQRQGQWQEARNQPAQPRGGGRHQQ